MIGPCPPAPHTNCGNGKPQQSFIAKGGGIRAAERRVLNWAESGFDFASHLTSPRRILWAVQAGWRGENVRSYIRARLGWHVVNQITLSKTETGEPILRVTSPMENAACDQAESTNHAGSSPQLFDSSRGTDSHPDPDSRQSFTVIGAACTVTAELSGVLPPFFRERLQNLCDDANAILADPLLGDEERLNGLQDLALAAQTQNITPQPSAGWGLLTLSSLFLVAAAVVLGVTGVQHYQWQQSVGRIDDAAGIEVISHTTRWGRRQIEILRDPLADPMNTILKSAGLEVASVDVKERPFVSGEPLFIASRAKMNPSSDSHPVPSENDPNLAIQNDVADGLRLDMVRALLELPADLELTLNEGRLSGRGVLSEPTFSGLAQAQSRIPWIKSVDVSQVRNLTEENITSLKEGLEKTQIEFLAASFLLPEASKLRLQSVGSELRMLAEETKLQKQQIRLQFYASHPDVDSTLQMRRVETLVRTLQREGMPATWFDPASGILEAKSPHSVTLRIQILSPTTAS